MSPVTGIISVAAGGAVGASARYLLVLWLHNDVNKVSWSILGANVLGSLLAGFLTALVIHRLEIPPALQLFLITGMLGGFTTFSAFSVNTLAIAETGQLGLATANVVLNVVGSLLAVGAGWWIARVL